MSRTRLVATVLTASLALTACGGNDDKKADDATSSDSAPAVAASTGEEQSTSDFSFNAPDGWKANDGSAAPSINFEVLAIDPDDKDGFSDNVNVVSEPAIARYDDLDDRAKAAEKGLAGLQTEGLKVDEPVTVDGEDAAVISATATAGGGQYDIIQYYVSHGDDKGYVVTFSFSTDRPEAEQQEIAQSVAASWKWKS
ncbi:MAG: hypothetical protein EON52_26200 [Actinomycetales bacterium]|nr:MAG: hypothetical protein EON52_26200 [Actinomycetales bacterium]